MKKEIPMDCRKACKNLLQTAPVCYFTTIDSRGYPCTRVLFNLRNQEQFQGLMPAGSVNIEDSPALKRRLWQNGWERYYPEGPDDPDYTILSLNPELAQGWYHSRRFEFRFQCT